MNLRQPRGTRAGLLALAAACALLGSRPAHATLLDFSSLAPSTWPSGTTLTENGIDMNLIEGPVGAFFGVISATGTVADGNDPSTCDILACPADADGNYLMLLNDGAVRLTRSSGIGGFKLMTFDLAFLSPVPIPDGDYGRLRLSGVEYNGNVHTTTVAFPGQNANGDFRFDAAALAQQFSQVTFTSLTIDACLFDGNGGCVNSLDNPAYNQAQFALDNIELTEVPEPASVLLAGIGIGALALQRRRAKPVKEA